MTHLDIEHPDFAGIIPPKIRTFIWITGIEDGILIRTEKSDKVKVVCPVLNHVLHHGEKTKTYVGGKFNGIFIGFRKRELSKLEKIVETSFLGNNPFFEKESLTRETTIFSFSTVGLRPTTPRAL